MDFLEEELEEILNIFREESEEHIQNINQNLLKLEKNPNDMSVISELFREAHSIKGSARMIGLDDIQRLAHKLEDILGYAKEYSLKITPEIIDVLCKSNDCIASIVDESVKTKGEFRSPEVDKNIKELEAIENKVLNAETPIQEPEEKETAVISEKELLPSTKNIIEALIETIPNIKKNFIELKDNNFNKDYVQNFHSEINAVDKHFADFDNKKLKEPFKEIQSKLEWVKKGSGILSEFEIAEIKENLNSFIEIIKNISINIGIAIDGLEIINCNDLKKENIQTKQEDTSAKTPSNQGSNDNEQSILGDNLFTNIDHHIEKLTESSHLKESSEEISRSIEKFSTSIKQPGAKDILEKLSEAIKNIMQSEKALEKEVTQVLKESLESANKLENEENSDVDSQLIIQRLTILQQMVELSANVPNETEQEYAPALQQAKVIPKIQNKENESHFDPKSSKNKDSGAIKTLRVDTKKLDQLVNQVGELIVAKIKTKEHINEIEKISRNIEDWHRDWHKTKQHFKYTDKKSFKELENSQVNPISTSQKNILSLFEETSEKITGFMNQINILQRSVQEDDARLNMIVNELEQMVKSVRVLPLATIFHMFPRMVRDISRDKGKQVELIISGSETSADKKVIEEIKSPLTHIIRNAIDHGIETPEERINNGKNPTGKIFLSAYHLENSILIEIIDDGRGIDIEKIKAKAIQKSLLSNEELESMSENQIMNIIFWPGFSTGEMVTDISGRGVGLDVVHTKISHLNGKVNIKSKPGEGCKVSIQLPVTMATIKSFLVSINEQTFAIPTNTVKTAIWMRPQDIFYKEGKKTIIVGDSTVPIFKLSEILEMPENPKTEEPEKYVIVVIEMEDTQVGFIIDKLLGDHEILHKNLSPPLIRVRNIAGVTTLGSGELCLILNVNDLIKSAVMQDENLQRQDIATDIKKTSSKINNNILVIDDSMTTRILQRNILKAAGYNVTVAINGLDALTKLNAQSFDLVVSDVEMPEINGIELTKKIREDANFKNLPVILVTSLASERDERKGFEAGADAYIKKGNFDQNDLLETIKNLLKH